MAGSDCVVDRVADPFVDRQDQELARLGDEGGRELQRLAHLAVGGQLDHKLRAVLVERDACRQR